MPLPKEKIREAILSPDPDLRWGAIAFFRAVPEADPALMPLVIQACEQYGLAAFDFYSFLEGFAQDAASLAWIRRQLDEWDHNVDTRTMGFLRGCIDALSAIDPAALSPPEFILPLCRRIDEGFECKIADRLLFADLAPDELWQRLADLCRAADQDEDFDFDPGPIFSAARALARHPADCREKVMEILARKAGHWLEVAATHLAGALRLEAAVPYLIDVLDEFDTAVYDEANFALADIGTDAVVRQLEQLYIEDADIRLDVANLLGDIHTELSATTALKLVEHEEDEELRLALFRSALESYATEAIEPARQWIIAMPEDPELLDLREFLLLVCKMLDVRIPEYDEWLADSADDREFRRRLYRESQGVDIESLLEGDEDALLEQESWFDDELADDFEEDEPTHDDAPIVRQDRHVGRNDPCPCGSGKKYKKCCLHKPAIE